jgi:hypothetical protein
MLETLSAIAVLRRLYKPSTNLIQILFNFSLINAEKLTWSMFMHYMPADFYSESPCCFNSYYCIWPIWQTFIHSVMSFPVSNSMCRIHIRTIIVYVWYFCEKWFCKKSKKIPGLLLTEKIKWITECSLKRKQIKPALSSFSSEIFQHALHKRLGFQGSSISQQEQNKKNKILYGGARNVFNVLGHMSVPLAVWISIVGGASGSSTWAVPPFARGPKMISL